MKYTKLMHFITTKFSFFYLFASADLQPPPTHITAQFTQYPVGIQLSETDVFKFNFLNICISEIRLYIFVKTCVVYVK